MDKHLALTVHLTEQEAEAFAQLLKRVVPEDFERRAGDLREAGLMASAAMAIQRALREKGYAPR